MPSLFLSVLILFGCNHRNADEPLPPDVEAYAVERTPAVYKKFQEARAELLRIKEGKRLLAADLKKLSRSWRDDATMQGMLSREKSIEDEINRHREYLESSYLRERKFLLGLTAEGVPSSSGRPASRALGTPVEPSTLRATAIKENVAHLSSYAEQTSIPESPKNYQSLEVHPSVGKVGDHCWAISRYVIEDGDGVYAIEKGTQLEILGLEDSFIMIVSDGRRTFRVPTSLLTSENASAPVAAPRSKM